MTAIPLPSGLSPRFLTLLAASLLAACGGGDDASRVSSVVGSVGLQRSAVAASATTPTSPGAAQAAPTPDAALPRPQ